MTNKKYESGTLEGSPIHLNVSEKVFENVEVDENGEADIRDVMKELGKHMEKLMTSALNGKD